CPARSSTSCTVMCRDERVTTIRGFCAVPTIFLRTRACLRERATRRCVETSLPIGRCFFAACLFATAVSLMITYPSFRPYGGCAHPRNKRPWPCTDQDASTSG